MDFGKSDGGGRRSAQRMAAPLTAVVTTFAGSRSLDLVDLSASGVRLAGERLPPIGEELMVTVDKARGYGLVVWSEHGQCGIEFDEPLAHHLVQAIRQQVAQSAGLHRDFKAAMDDWAMGMAP